MSDDEVVVRGRGRGRGRGRAGAVVPDNCSGRCRGWVFTLNNYSAEDWTRLTEVVAQDEAVRYIVIGKEVGESGTPHLQGYVLFTNARVFRAVKDCVGVSAHLERQRGTSCQAADYCKKEGEFFELGDCPQNPKDQGAAEKERWTRCRKLAELGEFDDIDADIYMRCYSSIKRIRQDRLEALVLPDNPDLKNYWFHGPSGCGKSSSARRLFPGAFLKMKNKWWNGYKFQEVCIIDDIDPTHKRWIGAFLKEWSDHYMFSAESKGGVMVIRPKIIVVTSQYSIGQVFTDSETGVRDVETVVALERRFVSFNWYDGVPDFAGLGGGVVESQVSLSP